MRKRKKYTKEFKESAIELYHRSGEDKTAKEVAEDLGISPENLRRWLTEAKKGESENIRVFPGHGIPRDEELFQLRKRVADLEETNEILKKATAYFATIKTR
jgi:transposase